MEPISHYPDDFNQAAAFHGHVCPGLSIGYRAAKSALAALKADRPDDEQLVAIVENDSCAVDAIQYILGCTFGKGNMIYRDHGKQVYTVISRKTGKAVRLAMKPDAMKPDPQSQELFQKVRNKEASAEEIELFGKNHLERSQCILEVPEDKLFKIESVSPQVPEAARIFQSVVCDKCGEGVMEPRARIEYGKTVCIPCLREYRCVQR